MNQIKAFIAIIILILTSIVSYQLGKASSDMENIRNYEAACLQADFIRFIIDRFDGETEMANIGMEIKNTYEEYFQELDNPNSFKTKGITSIKDFNNYYWCY